MADSKGALLRQHNVLPGHGLREIPHALVSVVSLQEPFRASESRPLIESMV